MENQTTRTGAILHQILQTGSDFIGETVNAGKQSLWSDWFGLDTASPIPPTEPTVTANTPSQTNAALSPVVVGGGIAAALLIVVLVLDK